MNINTTSIVPRFPQELIDIVIKEIGRDKPTLRSCALVCHAFLPTSQARIFSHITLHSIHPGPTGSRARQRLQQILQESSHLCAHVRSLKIVESGCVSSATPGPWMSMLIALLSMFKALTSFAFEARKAGFWWTNIPKELRNAISRLCERSSLTQLRLDNAKQFSELDEFTSLVASPTLSYISLRHVDLPLVTEPEMASQRQLRPTWCSLLLRNPTLNFMLRWLSNGDLSHLQSLEVTWAPGETSHLQRIINLSAANLEKLWLIPDQGPASYASHTLILPRSTKLSYLDLRFTIDVSETDTMASWIARLLGSAQGPSTLTTIVVKLALRRTPNLILFNPLNHPILPIQIDWAPLGNVLNAAQFPALRSFLIDIRVLSMGSGSDSELKSLAEDAKRSLHDLDVRGVLKFGTNVRKALQG
ncbi:hypothetical protein FB451DRAFT_1566016 [Mycena latifolia]|nr:hypothetical protein FB451DRAFT_1566016 [Mycena latifolia]